MARSRARPGPTYELKHRLTGAAIMILGAVVLIPLLLREPALEGMDWRQSASGARSFKSTIESPARDTVTAAGDESAAMQAADAAKPALLNTDGAGWTVRVGTYANPKNVDDISRILTENGFNARYRKAETDGAEATLIWLGPFADRAAADEVSQQLKPLTGEKGYVTWHGS